MKTRTNTSKYNWSSLLLIGLFLQATIVMAQTDVQPVVIKQSAKVKANPKVDVLIYDVPTDILPATGNEIKVELEYYAEGKNEDLKKLRSAIEENLLSYYQGDNSVDILLNLHNYFELQIMGMKWSRVTTKGSGKKETIKLKEFKIKSYKIWLPANMSLNLDAKYSRVNINTNINGPVNLKIYDSQLTTQSIAGDVEGEMKYSSLMAHSLGNVDLELYETKLKAEESLKGRIDAKYSDVSIRNMQALKFDGYEGNLYLSNVPTLDITMKYTNLSIVSANQLNLSAYEGASKLGKIGDLVIEGKYLELKGEELKSLKMVDGYENEITFNKIESLISTGGKYNEFKIGEVTKQLIIDGYEEEVDIDKMQGNFEKIELSGKYLESDITIYNPQAHTLSGLVQYPDLNINEKAYTIRKKVGDSSKLEFEYEFGDITQSKSKITINGYECDVNLHHVSN